MSKKKKALKPKIRPVRHNELKDMLLERRDRIRGELHGKLSNIRGDGMGVPEALDRVENTSADIDDEIEFALIELKSETLTRINAALERLERDDYGYCFDCGEEISEKRLRAVPFVLRCKDCEEAREKPNG